MHDRIPRLRDPCLQRKAEVPFDTAVLSADVLRQTAGIPHAAIRTAQVCRARIRSLPFAVDEASLLMGRVDFDAFPVHPPEAIAEAQSFLKTLPPLGGQSGHCELETDTLLQRGISDIARQLEDARQSAGNEASVTLESFRIALDGFSDMVQNAAQTAETAAAHYPEPRRAELSRMAGICRHIAQFPPRSFHEALQLLFFQLQAVSYGDRAGLVSPGRLDRRLRSFYDQDLRQGTLRREEALELLECFYILLNEWYPDGGAVAIMVGGRDAGGRDMTHPLSYLCLEAIRKTGMIYPTVGICRHEGTPDALIDLAIDLIAEGFVTPAFFGDETIRCGLSELDVPPEEACDYINSTCVEITPCGASNVWVASPYYNLCGLLLDELHAHRDGPTPSFEDFLTHYRERLADAIRRGVHEQNQGRQNRFRHGGKPLQSVFTRDCIARAQDIDRGGARYNWVECSFVGLANLADSLAAIRAEIFEQQRMGIRELCAALDADFSGYEPLRQRLAQAYPKYGQNHAETDALVAQTVAFVVNECRRHRMHPDDSAYVPGAFVWIMHERLGRETGATPDGRHAGFPFADGCGPAQGRETRGPTAAILSTTSWDHRPMIGGLAYNLKYPRSLLRSRHGKARLRDLVVTFLKRGGFEMQINVADAATLRQAQAQPDAYRDLVVRVGGYCDYFTRLNPEMQREIIQRTEFEA